MTDSKGKHLLMDFYGCYEDALIDEDDIIDAFINALKEANFPTNEVSFARHEEDFSISALDESCHVFMHVYANYGYVAVDIFSFERLIHSPILMKSLKDFFGAEKVKVTSINRGDFGQLTEMKPRSKTTITAKARVKRTGKQIKITGSTLKKTGIKVLKTITKKNKNTI